MKNWSCPRKIEARRKTVLPYIRGQYWTMCGDCTSPQSEFHEAVSAGLEPDMFHGVEIDPKMHAGNLTLPGNWYCGDFYEVMAGQDNFEPGLVNIDLIQMPSTSADYVSKILALLVDHQVTVIVNFVLEHRGKKCSPQQAAKELQSKHQFRYALRNGFRLHNQYYLYGGTGENSQTVMGTFRLDNLKQPCIL